MLNDKTITDLLLLFRQCDNYADRLAFWECHNLTDALAYTTSEFENNEGQVRTWEDVKQRPILTLAPFTHQERLQLAEWAIKVRSDNSTHNGATWIKGFVDEYNRLSSKERRGREPGDYLVERKQGANQWIDDYRKVLPSLASRRMIFEDLGIDEEYLGMYMDRFKRGQEPEVWQQIVIGSVWRNWAVIDTYLFAKAQYEMAVFLEQFDPTEKPAPIPMKADVKPSKTTLAECFEHASKYAVVMGLLVEKGFCQTGTYLWIDESPGFKGTVAVLIKYLHSQGFYGHNYKPSTLDVIQIAQNTFGIKMSKETVQKVVVPSSNTHNLSFIRPASTY